MPLFPKQAPALVLLAVSLGGCGSDPDFLDACPAEGTPVADDVTLPWGASVSDAAGLTVGSATVALTAELPSGAWSSNGTVSTVRAGEPLAFSAGDSLGCPHADWIEAPLTLTLTSDDRALSAEVDATGRVWGDAAGEAEFVAKLPFLDFGEPFASIVADASADADADAEGCVVGAPHDTVLLTGTFEDGAFGLDINWTCDDGNTVRAADTVYTVRYVAP